MEEYYFAFSSCEFHVSECTLFPVVGNACGLDLNAFPLSFSAAIFDSIV